MTEEAELQAKIAAISGKINQRKQFPAPIATTNHHYPSLDHRGFDRWSPYGRGHTLHKNKSLVLTSNTPTAVHDLAVTTTPVEARAPHPVSRNRHQSVKHDTYEQERRVHPYQGNERAVKRQKADQTPARELEIEGIRFRLQHDGGKLIRVLDDDMPPGMAALETPKKATVSGVVFLRTKHGNLIRDNLKARYFREHHQRNGHGSLFPLIRRSSPRSAKPQCEHFTKHGTVLDPDPPTEAGYPIARKWPRRQLAGTCPFGPRCKFNHDPNKVAICKDYLRTATCAQGIHCDMSHDMTYHRVSACTYYLRGNCTKGACRYPHVHVSPAASVCRPFATLGFCAKGPDCDKRHVFECPEYANRGFCANRENGKCLLPHPDRASTLRKVAERQTKLASGGESDVSSDEDRDVMDIDSDVVEELTGSDEDSHELTQQEDFIALS